MIDNPFQLPLRQTIASAAMLALFMLFALGGLASLLYGLWQVSHPCAFIVGGLILGVLGLLGALGRSGANVREDF
ncbi:MAG: hypothetical protein M3O02_11240 [Acidobacteriota bacterium]|nr:hypothetical protein [Acidobacteriota bacterium]